MPCTSDRVIIGHRLFAKTINAANVERPVECTVWHEDAWQATMLLCGPFMAMHDPLITGKTASLPAAAKLYIAQKHIRPPTPYRTVHIIAPARTERNGKLQLTSQIGTTMCNSAKNFWGFEESNVFRRETHLIDYFVGRDAAQPCEIEGDCDGKVPVELVDAGTGAVNKRYVPLSQLAKLKGTSVALLIKHRTWATFEPFKPADHTLTLLADGSIALVDKQVSPLLTHGPHPRQYQHPYMHALPTDAATHQPPPTGASAPDQQHPEPRRRQQRKHGRTQPSP